MLFGGRPSPWIPDPAGPRPPPANPRRLGQFLQRTREPVYLLDAQSRIAYVNPAWERLAASTFAEVVGLSCGPGPEPPPEAPRASLLSRQLAPPPEAEAGTPCFGPVALGPEPAWHTFLFLPLHDPAGARLGILAIRHPPGTPPPVPKAPSLELYARLRRLREDHRARFGTETLLGHGPAHERLLAQVQAAAASRVPAWIVGEPGTDRRTVARTIHALGPDRDQLVLPLDIRALSPELLETALFEPPRPEAPDISPLRLPVGGLLLLHDVEALPRDLQRRLIAAPGFGTVHLVATTTLDPDEAVRRDLLLTDLFYRLTTLVIRLAPLRGRVDELPVLARHFLDAANRHVPAPRAGFEPAALAALAAYHWPGNLRELARVVSAAAGQGDGPLITRDDLPPEIRGHQGAAYQAPWPVPETGLDGLLEQVERRLIEQALRRARQNKSRAADLLGISRPRLFRRITELNLPDHEKPEPPDDALHPEPDPGA